MTTANPVNSLFNNARKAAARGHCRAAITWLGMGWRAYGAEYGSHSFKHTANLPTGRQRGAALLRPLGRLQTSIMSTCGIPNDGGVSPSYASWDKRMQRESKLLGTRRRSRRRSRR